jgi:hypothetical protein
MKPRRDSSPEPEIILPGDPEMRSSWSTQRFGAGYPFVRTSHRVYTARLGPFGLIFLALALAVAAALMFILALGALLFWIPILVLIVAAAVISGLLRRNPGRWR